MKTAKASASDSSPLVYTVEEFARLFKLSPEAVRNLPRPVTRVVRAAAEFLTRVKEVTGNV